jgi:hypothetical protein
MITGHVQTREGKLDYTYYTPEEAQERELSYLEDWREVTEENEGAYVLSDSGMVVGPISVYNMQKRKLSKYMIVRIPTGTFHGTPGQKMTHEERENRWTFNGKHPVRGHNDPKRKLTPKEQRFVSFLLRYVMNTFAEAGSFDVLKAAELAYIAVTPNANTESKNFTNTVRRFARRANVTQAIDQHLQSLLDSKGISDEYVIDGFKNLADHSESDHVKLSVLRDFAKMRNIIQPDKSTTMLGLPGSGNMVFEGYSADQIQKGIEENAERKLVVAESTEHERSGA